MLITVIENPELLDVVVTIDCIHCAAHCVVRAVNRSLTVIPLTVEDKSITGVVVGIDFSEKGFPEKFFKKIFLSANVILIFGDKLSLSFSDSSRCVVFHLARNQLFAENFFSFAHHGMLGARA